MTDRRGGSREELDPPVLAPREEAALEESIRPVRSGGRGAWIASTLIVIAFVAGVARPWDWFTPSPPSGDGRPVASGALVPGTPAPTDAAAGPDGSEGLPTGDDRVSPTCGYPTSWRSATIQVWAGHRARVWSAVDVATASDPKDPAIEFQPVAGEDFTAIGWCAPVTGEERPPLAAHGLLFRIDDTDSAIEVAYKRLEPPASSSLGELWAPAGEPQTATGGWPLGRYVIVLEADDGSWARALGLDLRSTPPSPSRPPVTPSPSISPTPTAAPPSGSSAPTPGQTD